MMWLLWTGSGWAAPEVCNGVDDDGDGAVDEGPVAWGDDGDGDGHGAAMGLRWSADCTGVPAATVPDVSDCDDFDPQTSPGAVERCNGRDDDCDGQIDEGACGCDVVVGQGSVFLLCRSPLSWPEARAMCRATGFGLASIDTAAVQDLVQKAAAPFETGWWIGHNDLECEGMFAWSDGTPIRYDNFRYREPNDFGYGEDCVEIEPEGTWDDKDCPFRQAYICETPCTPTTWYFDADGDGVGDPTRAQLACGQPVGWVRHSAVRILQTPGPQGTPAHRSR